MLVGILLLLSLSLTTGVDILPADVFLDTEGISIAPGFNHICVLERQPGIEIGGRAKCWGKNDHSKCNPPSDVSLCVSLVFA